MKDTWVSEFIDFLGITDMQVKQICEHDQYLAEKAAIAYGADAVNFSQVSSGRYTDY